MKRCRRPFFRYMLASVPSSVAPWSSMISSQIGLAMPCVQTFHWKHRRVCCRCFLCSKCNLRQLKTLFSITLYTHEAREMGLRLLDVVGVFPGLGMRMTWGVFHSWGIFPVSHALLIRLKSSCSLLSGRGWRSV